MIWFEYLNVGIRVVTVNWIKLGNQKFWKVLNARQEEKDKNRKAGGEEEHEDGWIKSMGFSPRWR